MDADVGTVRVVRGDPVNPARAKRPERRPVTAGRSILTTKL
jgi:hypothetical protein